MTAAAPSQLPSTPSASSSTALLARLHPSLFLSAHLAHSSRPSSSSASPLQFPRVDVNLSPITSSSSASSSSASSSFSSLVRYGATTVLCNITPSVVYNSPVSFGSSNESSSSSLPSTASSSTVVPSISLTPLSSPSKNFRSGAPSEYAQAVTERLFTFLDASLPLDKSLLDISTREEVKDAQETTSRSAPSRAKWCLFADCTVIGFDGALVEACFLAIVTALRRVVLPRAYFSLDDSSVHVPSSPTASSSLVLKDHMIPPGSSHLSLPQIFTFGIYDGTLLATPSAFEDDLVQSRIEVCVEVDLSSVSPSPSSSSTSSTSTSDATKGIITLLAVHTTGPLIATAETKAGQQITAVDEDLIEQCIRLASARSKEIAQIILAAEGPPRRRSVGEDYGP